MALNQAQQAIVTAQAEKMGIPAAWALAVIDKESDGVVFYPVGGKQLPCIFIEGHYFYKYLGDTPKRSEAVAKGLASPKRFGQPGGVKVPGRMAARYQQFQRMIQIDEDAAYKSISIGVGQTMGAEYKAYGYKSAKEMFNEACKSFDVQVWQLLHDIRRIPARMNAIRNRDFRAFAKSYNGPKAPRSYWVDLERYVISYERDKTPTDLTFLRIQKLGYKNVSDFQAARGIEPDNIIGPITRGELRKAEADLKKADLAPAVDAAKKAAASACATVGGAAAIDPKGATDFLNQAVDVFNTFQPVLATLKEFGPKAFIIAAGAGLCFFAYRAVKAYLRAKQFSYEREDSVFERFMAD